MQIRGKVYDHLSIMYDMYNQVMILEVVDSTGGPGSIELRNEWIDQVIIDGILFKQYEDVTGTRRFGQVIFEGEVSCIYFWEKRYLPDMHEGENRYFFTEPVYEACILTDGKTVPYHGNRSFLKGFDSGLIPVIKTYLKNHHLNVKKASESEMKSLMHYLNGIV